MIIESDKASSSGASRPVRGDTTGINLSEYSISLSAASSDHILEPEEVHLPTYSPREQSRRDYDCSAEVLYNPDQRRLPFNNPSTCE